MMTPADRTQGRNKNISTESVTTDNTVDKNTADATVAWQTS